MKNNIYKIQKSIFLLFIFFTGFTLEVMAQSITYPTAAQSISRGLDSSLLTVRIDFPACTNPFVTVNLGATNSPGIIEYIPASITKTGGTAGLMIAQSNISNLQNPVFSISPSPAAGNFIIFTIKRRANCGNATATKDNVVVTGGCSFSEIDATVNPYPLLDPALTLTTSAALSNVNLGTAYDRTVTITNGANGCVDTLGFYLVYPTGSIQLNSLKIGATTLIPFFTNGDSSFFKITGTNLSALKKLCNGQSITLTENVTFKKCSPTTKYIANWYAHLNNDVCESTIEQIGSTMSNNLPILKASIPATNAYDYCMNGETKVQKVRIINSGMGPASNIVMSLRSQIGYRAYGSVYFDTSVAWQVTNRFGAVIGSVSNFSVITNLWGDSPNIPSCANQNNTPNIFVDGKGKFSSNITLGVGDTLYVDIVTKMPNFSCAPNFCAQYHTWLIMQSQLDYTSQCGTDSYQEPYKDLLLNYGSNADLSVENPLSINGFAPNNTFNITVTYSYFRNFNHPAGKGKTRIAIPLLGTGLSPTASVVYYSSYTLPLVVINDTMFIGPFPENVVLYGTSEIIIPMQANCSGGGGVKNLELFHLTQYDTTCSPVYKHDCKSTSIKIICPVLCPKGGATPMLFSLKRINYGQVDNNNDGWPDAGTIDLSKINVHHSVNGDTLQGVWNIKVNPNTDNTDPNFGGNMRYVYVDFELGTNGIGENGTLNALQNAIAEVWRGGSNIANLTISPSVIGTKAHYEFAGTGLAGGFWLGNDSVIIKAKYTVNQYNADRYSKSNYEGFDLFTTKNEVYSAYTQKTTAQIAPANGQTYTCEHLDDFNQISRIWVNAYMPLEQIINGCDNKITANMRQYTRAQEGGAIFPYEYRNFYIPDTLKVQLPPGFVYRANTANFNHTYSGNPALPISNSNIYQINDTLVFKNLRNFYTYFGGTLLAGDESEDSKVEFSIDPTCASSLGIFGGSTSNIAKGNGINTPANSLSAAGDIFIQPNIYIYDAPLPQLTTGGPSITSTDALTTWNVVLQNISSTIDAPSNYFYITPINGLTNIVVKEGATVLTPNANGFYILNTLVKGANRNFTISAKTTNCNIDSIRLNQGWSCNGYPSSFTLQSCTKTLWLKIANYQSQIQLSVTKEASSLLTVCSGETVDFVMNSAQAAFADNPVFKTTPPTGMTITSGQIEYPVGSGNWETITPTILSGEYTYAIKNHSQVVALWGTKGLPGSVNYPGSDQRQAKLRITFGIDCSFITGSKLTVKQQAYRPCGDAISNVLGFNKSISTQPINVDVTAPCYINATDYAITPQTGSINWNSLAWSLGRPPTCCESAHITYTGTNTGFDAVTVNITNDICIKNLTLLNTATSATNKIFKTIVSPGYNMVMNGYVRMTASGALSSDSCIFFTNGGGTITVNGNTTIGYPTDNAYCVFGTSPAVASNENYILKGDSLTFNNKSFTTDKFMTVVIDPVVDTAYFVNNTNVAPYTNAVSFENFRIGNAVKSTTVIASGSNQNSFMNDRAGALEVTTNGTLILPANYTINAIGIYNSSLQLRSNSTLRIGGYLGGSTGSNFPANFSTYNAHAQSLVEYYGGSSSPQTVHGMTYGKLELLNGTDGNGSGRAQKNSIAPIAAATLINVNKQMDFTLGGTVSSTGLFNITGGSGLYCNANVVSGAGVFTLGDYSYLGLGHPQGISLLGNATGNMQMAGARNYNVLGNYIYNGTALQITGNGLPATINELTTDNPTTVTNTQNVLVNSLALLKQGVFDIVATKFTSNGINGILNSTGGKMKADNGIVEMMGTSGTAQNLSGNWFVNKTIATLTNANTKGITVAIAPADTLLISKTLNYGASTSGSTITTNDNLTLLSRFAGTANFGEVKSGNAIVGKVNIERYLFAQKSWRFLSSPVQLAADDAGTPTIAAAWREGQSGLTSTGYGTAITWKQGPTFGPTQELDYYTQRGSIKYYDDANNVWIELSNTTITKVANTQGYMLFVRGDRGVPNTLAGVGTVTNMRIKGKIRTGDQTFSVLAGSAAVTKFQSIGNPYPSQINFAGVKSTSSNIANSFIVWNPKLPGLYGVGGYENYSHIGGGIYTLNGQAQTAFNVRNTIESGEAFFVQNSSATAGSVLIKEADKGVLSNTVSRGTGTGIEKPTIDISLFEKDSNGNYVYGDGLSTSFNDSFSAGINNEDVVKFTNANDNLFIKSNNKELVVERRPVPTEADSIQLGLTGTRAAAYRLQIDPYVFDNITVAPFLVDKYLQTTTALSTNNATNYDFAITADAASKTADRFVIIFKQGATTHFTTIAAARNTDKTITVNFGTANEKNVTNYIVEQSQDGTNFTALPATIAPTSNIGGNPTYTKQDATASKAANWYRVKTANSNGSIKYSAIAMVAAVVDVATNATAKMSIYPNPVEDGVVNLHMDNQPQGSYAVQIASATGQIIHKENVQVENNSTMLTIKIGTVAAGNYQATVVDGAGTKTTIVFVVK